MKKRLFIALNLPDEIKKKISSVILELDKLNRRVAIKWVRPELLHLTLHFLGYLDQAKLEEIESILANLCGHYREAVLSIGNLGAFPNLISPRVIYLEIKQNQGDSLLSLQKEVGEELIKISLEPDQRPWQSHLTLGRVKGKGKVNLSQIEIPNLTFKINSVELMESRLGRSWPEYFVVKSFPFLN